MKKKFSATHRDAAAFVAYYAKQSLTPTAQQRSRHIFALVTKIVGETGKTLEVADIGCGPGAQSMIWALAGHSVHGLDVNEGLLAFARERAAAARLAIDFQHGSAEALPFADASMDVCLVPELLEHVPSWEVCLREFARVLKPNGVLYLSTTNRLCPVQMEYRLPFYSWYPRSLKRYCERLAVTTHPEWVSHATHPAVHWFTFYELRDHLETLGLASRDRFDLLLLSDAKAATRLLVYAMRAVPPLRWLGHLATPYTTILAVKTNSSPSVTTVSHSLPAARESKRL